MEYPRQMEEDNKPDTQEVMEYKASQKLVSPDQDDRYIIDTSKYSAFGSAPSSSTAAPKSEPRYSHQVQALNYGNHQYAHPGAFGYSQTAAAVPPFHGSSLGYSRYDFTNDYNLQFPGDPYGFGRSLPPPPPPPFGLQSASTFSSIYTSNTWGGYIPPPPQQPATFPPGGTPGFTSGPYYNRYDPAGFAAATQNYLPSQSTANKRLNMKAHRKNQILFCQLCNVSCSGEFSFEQHLDGRNHRKNEAMFARNPQKFLPPVGASKSEKILFRCDICDVAFTDRMKYDSHVSEPKHQTTLERLQKMGQSIPNEPTVVFPEGSVNGTTPAVAVRAYSLQIPVNADEQNQPLMSTVTDVPTVNQFVGGGTNLAATDANKAATKMDSIGAPLSEADMSHEGSSTVPAAPQILVNADEPIQPLMSKVIETSTDCDKAATINDVSSEANMLHEKSTEAPTYSPQIPVMENRNTPTAQTPPSQSLFGGGNIPIAAHQRTNMYNSMGAEDQKILNDEYVIKKFNEVRMTDSKHKELKRYVDVVERAMKYVSDKITEVDYNEPKPESLKEEKPVEEKPQWASTNPNRTIRIIMQVGILAYDVLMDGDHVVDIVLVSTVIPTKRVLVKIIELLPDCIDVEYKEKITVTPMYDAAKFLIDFDGFDIQFRITLTSPDMRDYENGANVNCDFEELPKDSLPLAPCLDALAELRRERWFTSKASRFKELRMCVIVLRDYCQRIDAWKSLNPWILTVFVQNVLESSESSSSPSDAITKVFEIIASGMFLYNRAALCDPCEKGKDDIMELLSPKERQAITACAQNALHSINSGEIYAILDMKRIENTSEPKNDSRKRPYVNDENVPSCEEIMLKKEKLSAE